jgi:hypothetical protein
MLACPLSALRLPDEFGLRFLADFAGLGLLDHDASASFGVDPPLR